MSWKDRLQKNAVLISPEGIVFRPVWIGNPRSFEKKIAIFSPPGVKGASFQDLEFSLTRTPLTLYFGGDDNDREATRFFETCKQKGEWTVIHPVKGTLSLQLSKVSEGIAPVESGGLTVIDTEWFETGVDAATPLSLSEKASIVKAKGIAIDILGIVQFVKAVIDFFDLVSNFVDDVTDIVDYVQKKVRALTNLVAEANSFINSIVRGITQTLSATVISIEALAGQIQTLIQFPATIERDIIARLNVYSDMINDSFDEIIFPNNKTGSEQNDKNRALAQELFLVSAMTAECEIAVSGTLETREESIEVAQKLIDDFNLIVDNLDILQGHFDDKTIDLQYFNQSDSYESLMEMVSLAVSYVLSKSFELAIEKRFIIKRPRAPIEIAIIEYNGPGIEDSNLDLFLRSNNLHGKDIISLKAGTEVVVYV
ncbi:DNA circularization N-terminal domain-containing protein [bacterium]|nr:DNA circularization N-terminal domain-containing protein [bacterium]